MLAIIASAIRHPKAHVASKRTAMLRRRLNRRGSHLAQA